MSLAHPIQNFKDWLTQQWVILSGERIDHAKHFWLIGPYGNRGAIGEDFIQQLALKENLVIRRDKKPRGIIPSIAALNLADVERARLSGRVVDFYERTSGFQLTLTVKWNPFFKLFGWLVNSLFSSRINQLNIPLRNDAGFDIIQSEVISLEDASSGEARYTIWLRSSGNDGKVMYSGIYGTCVLPSGQTCIKTIFPLPQGNATVILIPRVGRNGELILESAGKRMGDAGFYFLLKDVRGNHWARFISSFRDRLSVADENGEVRAEQILTLWGARVLTLTYKMEMKALAAGTTNKSE